MDHIQPEIALALRQNWGRERPRRKRRRPEARVRAAGRSYPVITMWEGGFSVAVEDAPRLRGFVDLMAGENRLARCLIICASEEGGVVSYEYKRRTTATDHPPADYELSPDRPAGLLA